MGLQERRGSDQTNKAAYQGNMSTSGAGGVMRKASGRWDENPVVGSIENLEDYRTKSHMNLPESEVVSTGAVRFNGPISVGYNAD